MEPMLTPGETRTSTVGGVVISVYAVSGGSFTTVQVRRIHNGRLLDSFTDVDETAALRYYRMQVRKYSA